MVLWKREKQIEQAVREYLAEAEACLESFGRAFEVYFAGGLSEEFKGLMEETAAHEAKSDDMRRDIEMTMYGKALIPESRGDILGMLEAIDLVPNKAESVLYMIWFQNTEVPDQFVENMKALIHANRDSVALLCEAARMLFAEIGRVVPIVDQVSIKEGESDRIERALIKSIFDSTGDKADKILLKELILEIGAISDRAENASDRLRIIAIKRQT